MKLLKAILHVRACVYKEAYIAEVKSGGDSWAIAACLVGIFDAPLIMAMFLMFDSFFVGGSIIRDAFSSNLTSVFSVFFTMFVLSFEYVYYRVFKVGLQQDLALLNSKVVGVSYAAISLVGGAALVYLVW